MQKKQQSYLIMAGEARILFASVCAEKRLKDSLFVWRDHPQSISSRHRASANILWVTNIQTNEEHINPNDIEQLSYSIEKFIRTKKKSLVVLSCVEYLISYNSFNDVLHLVQTVRDLAADNNATFAVFIGKGTLAEHEENLLRNELTVIGDTNEINWTGN